MEEELIANIKKFWNSAELVYNSKDYTSATILYFKCWFVLLDYVILKNKRIIPKDHSERFKILNTGFKKYYYQIDRQYPLYRQTYHSSIERTKCDNIRIIVKEIIHEQKIII